MTAGVPIARQGYYELEPVGRLCEQVSRSWPENVKGKAVKVVSDLLKDLPTGYFFLGVRKENG